MQHSVPSLEEEKAFEQILGYLNFSSGAPDPGFLCALNRVFQSVADHPQRPAWREAVGRLHVRLSQLAAESSVFRDASQAVEVLRLVGETVLPGYLQFHRDLLFHQGEPALFNSFFVGRVCEAVLQQGPPWSESERIAAGAIRALNDYIGHRPVAALESRKLEPYPHEWVRPVPLYVRDCGAAVGPYQEVLEIALDLLGQTDEQILREAYFDLDQLDELAFDPRAYDFDHPANKRPNYHFGHWDPHHIDNRGFYRRYVVRQITLDALMARLNTESKLPREQLVVEAAAVLAGTIIMSTGISGAGPDSHDSSVSLANLLPRIAAYRDAFYEQLLGKIGGPHGQRLTQESRQRRQPFGGARQHLNAELARRRAAQLEHVHLAAIFARMGYPDEAVAEANVVPAASARMLCHIDCCLAAGDRAVTNGELQQAADLLEEIMDWVRRGIECGAIVDPWSILGFDGNFSLFAALENSVRDHRVDELVALMEQIFAFYSRVWSDAAARSETVLCEQVAQRFRETATWWRKYAAHEVSSVEAIDADEAYSSAQRVAHALTLWHQGGAAAEDIRFWAPHASVFDSPKAYGLVVANLLERGDFVASMALMMHWLDQADSIGLEKGDTSFFDLSEHWIAELQRRRDQDADEDADEGRPDIDGWALACKFLDCLEANAEEYWEVPNADLQRGRHHEASGDAFPELLDEADDEEGDEEEEEDDDDQGGLFSAAYEDVVFRDSTDDGIESELADEGPAGDDDLLGESKRLSQRLSFLSLVARLWQWAVTLRPTNGGEAAAAQHEILCRWIRQAAKNRQKLRRLIDQLAAFSLPLPSGDHDSMVEYDRVRMIKESILESAITTSVDMVDAGRILAAAAFASGPQAELQGQNYAEDELKSLPVLAGLFIGDPQRVRRHWQSLLKCLARLPLLYVPLARGGDPHRLVTARARQHLIQDLLDWLPRLGLVFETCQLIEAAREMERKHPVGPGAVTEFDDLFKIGYKALVRTVIQSADQYSSDAATRHSGRQREGAIVDCLKQLTESLLTSWLAHSRTLRLSVLERLGSKEDWIAVVSFIDRYGADIFTQRFLNMANLRAILHRGLAEWLTHAMEEDSGEQWRLLEDLESGAVSREDAERHLTLILEAVVENYGEYRDYNSMTTQSDRGELLYMLLDFLRLRTNYDRICWQLKPVVWAHELLVRQDQKPAAELWRREFTEQTRHQADRLLERLSALQQKYAMRMPTVADRLGERFVRPMAIDRMRALVRPAMEERRRGGSCRSFERLQEEADLLTRDPSGVGLDVPAWLVALEEEVGLVLQQDTEWNQARQLEVMVPQRSITLPEAQRQLERWAARMGTL